MNTNKKTLRFSVGTFSKRARNHMRLRPAMAGLAMPVRDEWVLTKQSKYLHRIQRSGEDVFTACRWRKGAASRKPIPAARIVWQGERAAARAMRIHFCPDRQCQP